MLDVLTGFGALLHSVWLLPLLAVMIAVDGPFPVLPSETILMSASALAFGSHDAVAVLALFLVAVVGSMIGDLLVFGLGRSSQRIVALTDARTGISGWVRARLLAQPGVALVGARLVPGGRLVSTAAAGRFGLPLRRFLPWTLASSVVWSCYMLLVGLALGPVTGGRPLPCLIAGVIMAAVTAGAFAIGQRIRARRAARRAVAMPLPISVSPEPDVELPRAA
ncbi:DedA family protein [Pseudonocardia humida]|uniref:VTT domain-containing protein n=1 Tax=Pseudonocardia humida TaxID=2800819 RepID=A0ABT1A133_9PSEU|nr:VTT domain-containing protein [Pseudonocardia humida]MCO1656524.1 VTT domain-containing protein [Pseudonocardia humida]